ncbi:MAG: hypothetical protein LOD91_06180, partial [Limnochordales bacterium]
MIYAVANRRDLGAVARLAAEALAERLGRAVPGLAPVMMEHSLRLDHYVLRTDEEIAAISRGFDTNIQFPDQRVQYSTRLEERELVLTQLSGEHTFADTPLVSKVLSDTLLENLSFDWFYSESEATTDIPNQARFQATALLDDAGLPVST